MADTKQQIQKSLRTSKINNLKKSTPRHILFKLQKVKDEEKFLKETKGKRNPPIEESG